MTDGEQDRLDALLTLFNEIAPITQTLGMSMTFDEDRRAVIELPYNPGLDHALEGIHGGVYMMLLDSAAWFTSAATRDGWRQLVTSDLTVHLLRPAARTTLRAVGEMLKSGRGQDVVEARLYDDDGRLVGHAVGTMVEANG